MLSRRKKLREIFDASQKPNVTQSERILHTPSDFAKKHLFYIQEAGQLKSLRQHTCRRQGLASYLFLIVLKGSGLFQYSQNTYLLQPGYCVFIDCNLYYSHESSADNPWELMWVHFNGPAVPYYHQYFLECIGDVCFQSGSVNSFTDIIHSILVSNTQNYPAYEIQISKLLTDLLTQCINSGIYTGGTITEKLYQIKEYLNTNFHKKISLQQLSSDFYISKYYMSHEFKRHYGLTIFDYLLNKRITYAKELLRFTDNSIADIALLCGFHDGNYFNKVFKHTESLTPSEFRRQWQTGCQTQSKALLPPPLPSVFPKNIPEY